jgi:hypothetical protein
MTIDRDFVLHLVAQRAGFTESQLDALRRRDYTALLTERIAVASQPEPDLAVDVVPDAPPATDLQADLERVSRRLGAIRQQRDAALHMLRQLAAKLGCCQQCWGTDASCAACAGRGSPGHFPPDPHLREWLGAALARRPDVAPSGLGAAPSPAATPSPDARVGGHEPAHHHT